MQINNSPRFIQQFMIGLVASGAGAFIALPSVAMPAATTGASAGTATEATPAMPATVEAIEGVPLAAPGAAPTEAPVKPTAAETLPTAGADDLTGDATDAEEASDSVAETEALEDAPLVEADGADEPLKKPVAGDDSDMDPVAEDDSDMEPVAEDDIKAPVAEEPTGAPTEGSVEAEESVEGADDEVADEMNTEEFTISELTNSSDSFEVLAAALEAADLTEVLAGEGPFTIFAPTDEAFEALPDGAVEQLLLPENKEVLVQVLTYHVVPSAVLASDLETGDLATVEGSDLSVDVADADNVTINNANVVFADVAAKNGVIHVIDRVMLPPAPGADADVDAPKAPIQ